MKTNIIGALCVFLALFMVSCSNNATEPGGEDIVQDTNEVQELKIENLLRESLGLTDSIEVIMSFVEIPKGTTLPFHYHPGEEFAYIIEGSGELLLKDESKVFMEAGSAGKVPLEKVHTFSTLDEGVRMVVFRVHKEGQPDRILTD